MPQLTRLDAPVAFELWRAELGTEPAEHELGVLSNDERDRADRFVFARDRRRFLAAHVALRQVLELRLGRAAHTYRFVAGPFGKPGLAGSSGCAFNLSHSDDVALIAMAQDGEIGVDVESPRVVDDLADLAERNFARSECEHLSTLLPAERGVAFLHCWTRKEACLKAIGSGLSIAPETFEAGVQTDTRVVSIATSAGHVLVEVRSLLHLTDAIGALARTLPA